MIGVIDSGSGGINVINECKKNYNEDFVYLVDNKNCPYGNKPSEEVKEIVLNNISYLIKNYDLDLIILGCNTASSILSYKQLEELKIPILKTTPNMEYLSSVKGVKILFATKNTLKKSGYVKYYLLNYNDIKTISIKDLPKHIDKLISENTQKNREKIKKILKKCVIFNKKQKSIQNFMALGCTHFKHITKQIKDLFNENIAFFECESKVAKLSKYLVRKPKMLSTVEVVLTNPDDQLKEAIIKKLL